MSDGRKQTTTNIEEIMLYDSKGFRWLLDGYISEDTDSMEIGLANKSLLGINKKQLGE